MLNERVYFAASIPRYLRSTRLSHLPLDAVIGSWAIENPHDINQTFDVVMLPEMQFRRALHWLLDGRATNLAYQRGTLMISYYPKDIKKLAVPDDTRHPARYAAEALGKLFNLDIHRTIYQDAPSVAASMRAPRAMQPAAGARMIAAPRKAAMMKDFRASPIKIAYPGAPRAARPRSRIIF